MYICASILQSGNDSYDYIVNYLEEIVYLVNSKGEWNVYVWGKRGLTNDVSILDNYIKDPGDNNVIYQDILTRFAYLHSSKKYYLNLYKSQWRSLDNLKFDFTINMLLEYIKIWPCYCIFKKLI